MFRFLVIVASIAAVSHGYSMGAPAAACKTMIPGHPAEPQEIVSPYEILLSKHEIRAGDSVDVTLTGKHGERFKGFLVQARVGDDIVGHFEIADDDKLAQTLDCLSGEKNAATQRDADEKPKVTLKWVAPQALTGPVVFKATFVKDGLVFWVAQESSLLTVRQ